MIARPARSANAVQVSSMRSRERGGTAAPFGLRLRRGTVDGCDLPLPYVGGRSSMATPQNLVGGGTGVYRPRERQTPFAEGPMPVTLTHSDPGFEAGIARLLSAERSSGADVGTAVAGILREVQDRGAEAVVALTRRFDRWEASADTLAVSAAEI